MFNKKDFIEVGEAAEVALSEKVRLRIQRKLKGEINIIDVRKWVRMGETEEFIPTPKGLFVEVGIWKEKLLPLLNELVRD